MFIEKHGKYHGQGFTYGQELMNMNKRWLKAILYILGIGIAIFILLNANWKEVLRNIKALPRHIFAIELALQIFTMILITIQWKSMVSWIGKKASFKDVFMVNIKGNIVDAITPGVKIGGELARVYELKNILKLDLGNASIIVGLQKTISLLSFLFLALISLIWFNFTIGIQYRSYLYLLSIAVFLFFILLTILVVVCLKPSILKSFLEKIIPNSKLKDKIDKVFNEYSKSLLKLLSRREKFFYQLLLGVLIWGVFAFKMLLIVKSFHIDIGFISVAAITYLTYVIGMIPLLPGSIGSFESSMVLLLSMKGIPIDIGVSISIVFRFITFWFEFLFSLFMIALDKIISLYGKGGRYDKVRI